MDPPTGSVSYLLGGHHHRQSSTGSPFSVLSTLSGTPSSHSSNLSPSTPTQIAPSYTLPESASRLLGDTTILHSPLVPFEALRSGTPGMLRSTDLSGTQPHLHCITQATDELLVRAHNAPYLAIKQEAMALAHELRSARIESAMMKQLYDELIAKIPPLLYFPPLSTSSSSEHIKSTATDSTSPLPGPPSRQIVLGFGMRYPTSPSAPPPGVNFKYWYKSDLKNEGKKVRAGKKGAHDDSVNIGQQFIEDERGNTVSGAVAKDIRETLASLLQSLVWTGQATETQNQLGFEALVYIHTNMANQYPYLLDCEGGRWKINKLLQAMYSGFAKHHVKGIPVNTAIKAEADGESSTAHLGQDAHIVPSKRSRQDSITGDCESSLTRPPKVSRTAFPTTPAPVSPIPSTLASALPIPREQALPLSVLNTKPGPALAPLLFTPPGATTPMFKSIPHRTTPAQPAALSELTPTSPAPERPAHATSSSAAARSMLRLSPPPPSPEPTVPVLPAPAPRDPALPAPALSDPVLPVPASSNPAPPVPTSSDPVLPAPAPSDPALPAPIPSDPALPLPASSDPALPLPVLSNPSPPAPTPRNPALPAPALHDPALPVPASSNPAPPVPTSSDPVLPAPAPNDPALPAPIPSNPAPPVPIPSDPALPMPASSNPAPPVPTSSDLVLPAPAPNDTALPAPAPHDPALPAPAPHDPALPAPALSDLVLPVPASSDPAPPAPAPSDRRTMYAASGVMTLTPSVPTSSGSATVPAPSASPSKAKIIIPVPKPFATVTGSRRSTRLSSGAATTAEPSTPLPPPTDSPATTSNGPIPAPPASTSKGKARSAAAHVTVAMKYRPDVISEQNLYFRRMMEENPEKLYSECVSAFKELAPEELQQLKQDCVRERKERKLAKQAV